MFRNVKNNAVRILELAFEVLFFLSVPELKKEGASGFLNALFRCDEVIDYKTEMVSPHKTVRVLQTRTFRSVIAKQCKIAGFAWQINTGQGGEFRPSRAP